MGGWEPFVTGRSPGIPRPLCSVAFRSWASAQSRSDRFQSAARLRGSRREREPCGWSAEGAPRRAPILLTLDGSIEHDQEHRSERWRDGELEPGPRRAMPAMEQFGRDFGVLVRLSAQARNIVACSQPRNKSFRLRHF
jgi:hypothetical protein